MRIYKQEMIDDFRRGREFCMTTIKACKKMLSASSVVTAKEAVAILAGLAEIKRVVEDYYGTI